MTLVLPDRFPTTFAEEFRTLEPDILDEGGRRALGELAAKGFSVQIGLMRQNVDGLTEIASQEAVRRYCWKDLDERFGNEDMAARWLLKARGELQLWHPSSKIQAAHGWEGPEECEYIPGSETTFAIRVNREFAGRGIGTLFTTVIVSGSAALYGARKVGLETWESNVGAGKAYDRAGAEFVTKRKSKRKTPDGAEVDDFRRYLKFTDSF